MKSKFFWAYKLNEAELKELFESAHFFFDTNALLRLYRVKNEVAKKIISEIAKYKDRISIPYHAAEEYHWHVIENVAARVNKTQEQIQKFNDPDKCYKDWFFDELKNYLASDQQEELKKMVNNFCNEANKLLQKHLDVFKKEFKTMELASMLSTTLSDCILPPLSEDEDTKCREEYSRRADKKIPPGYLDNTDKKKNVKRDGKSNEAGDYIIWVEILKWAKENNTDVIFISDDLKDDWIWKEKALTIGPRWELKKEFFNHTGGKRFHLLTLDAFLKLTDQFNAEEIKSIEEAQVKVEEIPIKPVRTFRLTTIDELQKIASFNPSTSIQVKIEELQKLTEKYKSRLSFEHEAKAKPVTQKPKTTREIDLKKKPLDFSEDEYVAD